MEISNNYYTFQTKENEEFSVSSKIKERFKNVDVVIPTEEKILNINGRKFLYYERLLPDYVFVGSENLSQDEFDKICEVKNIIKSNILNSPDVCKLSKEDINRFITKPLKKTNTMLEILSNVLKIGKTINIISGQYANYTATIKSINDNYEIFVIINIPTKPKVMVPLWFIGHELKEKVEA